MPYPPRWNTALAPAWPPAVTASASVLYAPSRRVTHAANWGAWTATRLGLGALRWRSAEPWSPPMGEAVFAELMAEWSAACGEEVIGFVVHRRMQVERSDGSALILRTRRAALFVKVTRHASELLTEALVAKADHIDGCAFRVPEILASGSTRGWNWTVTRTISLRPHAPVLEAGRGIERVADDATRLVEATLERPTDAPEHWTGSHGDLTPWNLRRVGASRSTPWLIDWSDAGWRPPGADRLYYRAVVAAIGRNWTGPAAVLPGEEEAAQHWAGVQATRRPAAGEERLHERLAATFGQVR